MRPTAALIAASLLASSLGMGGCRAAATAPALTASAPALVGTVRWQERFAAATTSDVSNGATVSLIDTVTGQTVGTTVTASNGSFTLNFGSSFRPQTSKPYYLEAVKGLPVGLSANRAGATLARIRTLLFYDGSGWKSLTSGALTLGPATTTLTAIVSLRGLSIADQSALVSKLTGTSFNASGTVIAATEFNAVYLLVLTALAQDQDPLEVLSYDATGATPAAQYLTRSSALVLHETFSPPVAAPGGMVSFSGQNLPNDGLSVSIGNVAVSTWSLTPSRTNLSVTLPGDAMGGLLLLRRGITRWTGPYLPVTGTTGTLAGSGYGGFVDSRGLEASFNKPHGIAADAAGNLYVADCNNNAIRKVTPSGLVSTLAGGGASGYADGSGSSARFTGPTAVAVDASGNVYVADRQNHRIRMITPAGVVSTIAGSGTAAFADGTGSAAQFNWPFGVAVDGSGTLYVSDEYGYRIRKVAPGGVVTTLAGSGTSGSADGTGTAATFAFPTGIAADGAGNVYVADYNANKIRKVTPGGVVTTLAGAGAAGSVDGPAGSAQFTNPVAVALDASGNVFVSDSGTSRLRKVSAGTVSTLTGGGSGYLDGPNASARFNSPYGLALAPGGSLCVSDYLNHRMRVLTP